MTGIKLKDRRTEERDVTYGPAVVGAGLFGAAASLTLFPLAAPAAVAVIFLGTGMWMRESVVENRTLRPPAPTGPGLSAPTVYWWGAVGFAVVQWLVLAATLRVANAHGILSSGPPLVQTTPILGHLLTANAALASLLGVAAIRTARRNTDQLSRPVTLFLATGLVHLLLIGIELARLAAGGAPPALGPRSATWLVFIAHTATVLFALVALAVLAVRARIEPLVPARWGIVQGLVLFWYATLISWFVLYAVFYLRLLRIESHLI